MTNLPHYQLFINGTWCEGCDAQTMQSINPADGKVWSTFACASADDVNHAVDAARQALDNPQWRDMLPSMRGKLLYKLADLIESASEAIGRVETTDSGKLATETVAQTRYVADYSGGGDTCRWQPPTRPE